MSWSSFNKPTRVADALGLGASEFVYGPSRARVKHTQFDGAAVAKTITYIGADFERRAFPSGPDQLVHYIRAGGSVVAEFTRVDDANPATDKTRYLHRDHLGSVALVTDEAGAVAEERAFGPWGQARNADWTTPASPPPLTETPRGFTGHEHLQTVGLIHMNGRVYDPKIGRFMSPDPSDALDPGVGFNRYAYVKNNPVSLVDPSGFETTPGSDDDEDFDPDDRDAINVEGGRLAPREWDPEAQGMTREELDLYQSGRVEPFDLEGFVGTFTGIPGIVKGIGTFAVTQIGKLAAKNIDEVAEAVVSSLKQRVKEVHQVLNPRAQRHRTTAGLQTKEQTTIFGGGKRDLEKPQREALNVNEVPAKSPGSHAEVTVIDDAKARNLTPSELETSRDICPGCKDYIESTGGRLTGPRTATWD